MLEREIKQLLDKKTYNDLLDAGILTAFEQSKQLQINYYYDTEEALLHRGGTTLRIRQKDAELKLELKYTVEDKQAYKVKREISKPVSRLPAHIDLAESFRELSLQGNTRLIHSLVTERIGFQAGGGITVDLDKSSYLGKTDYELEIEFPEGGEEEAHRIYKLLLPSSEARSAEGKNSRFFTAYFELMRSASEGHICKQTCKK
jgi:uncharacterized protein YjbK